MPMSSKARPNRSTPTPSPGVAPGRTGRRRAVARRASPVMPHVPATFAREAVRVRTQGHLSDQLIARATGAAPSTVRGWLALRSGPTGARAERVAELGAIVERLARVIRSDYIPVWLSKPLAALDDEKPVDVLGRGEYARVARLIAGLEESGAS